jgi:hypothetical protein
MIYSGIDEGGGSTMVDSPGGTPTVTHLLFRQIWKQRREMGILEHMKDGKNTRYKWKEHPTKTHQ